MKTNEILAVLLVLVILFSSSVYSQTEISLNDTNIIYFDYDPDVYIYDCNVSGSLHHGDTFKIDINDDNLNDLKFYFVPNAGYVQYTPIIQSMNFETSWALFPVEYSDSLANLSLYWRDSSNFYSSFRIGVRIAVGANLYYGWIRVFSGYQSPNTYFTIYERAFCKIPNYPFLWGQTQINTNIPEEKVSVSETMTISNNKDFIYLNSKVVIKKVSVTSVIGIIEINKTSINSKSAEINIANLANGAYIISVEGNDGKVYTKQIIK